MTAARLDPSTVRAFLDDLVQVGPSDTGRPRWQAVADDVLRLGLRPGQPVMVAVPNGIPFVTVVFALLVTGAVPILLPPSAPPSRIRRMGQVLGADALVAPRLPEQFAAAGRTAAVAGQVEFARLPVDQSHHYEPGQIVLLTSGTSGVFSGCLHRVGSLLLNAERHAQAIGQTGDDRVLINLPMHYSYAFVAQLLATFVRGGRAVLAGPPFTPSGYQRAIRDHGVTVSSLTPALVTSLLRTGGPLPAPLRLLTVGGDALAPPLVAELLGRNPGVELYLTYGLTEAGPRVATLAAHREPPERYGSVGRPLAGVDVRLLRATPDADLGELVVHTDTGMLRAVGRRHDDPETAADGRRVIRTGDLFRMDGDGYLFFASRRPSSVTIRGEKVFLRSVCAIAETIPDVLGADAWTHQDADGEVVFTLDVYCENAETVDPRQLRRQLATLLLRTEQPTHLHVHPAPHLGWRKPDAG